MRSFGILNKTSWDGWVSVYVYVVNSRGWSYIDWFTPGMVISKAMQTNLEEAFEYHLEAYVSKRKL